MAANGEEAGIGSMGTDSPLAVKLPSSKPLYNFRQMFAQVTNPPNRPDSRG